MADVIELTGIRALGTIGVLAEERERAQPFEVDLSIEVDLRAAGRTDALEDTIDYARPVAIVTAVIERGGYQLLERVAQRIADDILQIDGVKVVDVVVRKLRPPLPHDLASSAVRIRRSRSLVRAFVALGSNIGDRRAHLMSAVAALDPIRLSGVYETAPVGGPDGQGSFLNMVVELYTDLGPHELLDRCQQIELKARRSRDVHWGPRTLDVDILLYGEQVLDGDHLIVPHPRMWDRGFVLTPLNDLAPELLRPGWRDRVDLEGIREVDHLDVPTPRHPT